MFGPQKKFGFKIQKKLNLCRLPSRAVGKESLCRLPHARQSAKMLSLPTAPPGSRQRGLAPDPPGHVAICRLLDVAVGKEVIFADCRTSGQSAKLTATDAVYARRDLPTAELCRLLGSSRQSANNSLPTVFLCRLPSSGFADCPVWQSAKDLFADCPRFGSRQSPSFR